MKFYHLVRPEDADYDEVRAMVILAKDEQDARELASHEAGDEGKNAWLDANQSVCQELDPDKMAYGVLIIDFKAG